SMGHADVGSVTVVNLCAIDIGSEVAGRAAQHDVVQERAVWLENQEHRVAGAEVNWSKAKRVVDVVEADRRGSIDAVCPIRWTLRWRLLADSYPLTTCVRPNCHGVALSQRVQLFGPQPDAQVADCPGVSGRCGQG